jgi:hypothetical protein
MRIVFGFFATAILVVGIPTGVGAAAAAAVQTVAQLNILQGMPPAAANALNEAAPKTADIACAPIVIQQCYCNAVMGKNGCEGGNNKYLCPCADPRGVTGVCMQTGQCKALSAANLGGGSSAPGMDQLMKALGQALGQLMSGASSPAASTPTTGTCTTAYYNTSDPSLIGVDPCAQYVAPTVSSCTIYSSTSSSDASSTTAILTWNTTNAASASLSPGIGSVGINGSQSVTVTATTNYTLSVTGTAGDSSSCVATVAVATCDALSQALGICTAATSTTLIINSTSSNVMIGSSSAPIITPLSGTLNLTGTNGTTGTAVYATSTAAALSPAIGGASGNIWTLGNGATVVASSTNAGTNTEVAGFLGSDTFGSQPQSLVAQWCESRPWASNFLSQIIAPSFFDGICSWQGYQVGTPPPVAPPVLTQTAPAPQAPASPTPATSTPAVTPEVNIWAVPASVPLGARTSVFWSTQNVSNCTETSPDGSFNQSSLSGGAATVPLTGATTFTISCMAPDGTPVTGYTTVNLSI